MGLLLLAVAELAVVHQLADRRHRERRDLHQVHVLLFRHLEGLGDRHDAELVAVLRHESDLWRRDLSVDPLRSLECDV